MESWNEFMMIMTLCHSVQVHEDHFVASSPDEKALLDICKQFGFTFLGQSPNNEMQIQIGETEIKSFIKLNELEFDSFRKCMSVIVKDCQTGQIHMLSKGAEMAILPNCVNGPIEQTERDVDAFASQGLRTLVLCYKELSQEQYDEVG